MIRAEESKSWAVFPHPFSKSGRGLLPDFRILPWSVQMKIVSKKSKEIKAKFFVQGERSRLNSLIEDKVLFLKDLFGCFILQNNHISSYGMKSYLLCKLLSKCWEFCLWKYLDTELGIKRKGLLNIHVYLLQRIKTNTLYISRVCLKICIKKSQHPSLSYAESRKHGRTFSVSWIQCFTSCLGCGKVFVSAIITSANPWNASPPPPPQKKKKKEKESKNQAAKPNVRK